MKITLKESTITNTEQLLLISIPHKTLNEVIGKPGELTQEQVDARMGKMLREAIWEASHG